MSHALLHPCKIIESAKPKMHLSTMWGNSPGAKRTKVVLRDKHMACERKEEIKIKNTVVGIMLSFLSPFCSNSKMSLRSLGKAAYRRSHSIRKW